MCPQCFEINPPGATFCQLCGASIATGKDAAVEGSDTEVYRELAQTNLFRMRGAYKDAMQSCLGILKKYPNNATAHTLLGDIHAEMGELQQAAEWYEMALDLNPNSEGDKKKLAAVKARVQERERAQTAEQIGLDTHKRPNTGLYIGVMAALIVVVGGGAYALGSMAGGAKEKPPVERPVSILPPPAKPADAASTGGAAKPGGGEVRDPVPPAPVASAGSPDRAALDFLRAQGRSSSRVTSLVEDPRTQTVLVTAEADSSLTPQAQAALIGADVLTTLPNALIATIKITRGSETLLVADMSKAAWDQAKTSLADGQTAADVPGLLTNGFPAGAVGL